MAAPAIARPIEPMSPEKFLRWEARQERKHEYSPSGIRAMAGANTSHVLVTPNLSLALGTALRGKPCRFQDSDTKLWVATTQSYYYPDGMVACPPNFVDEAAGAIDNPTVVFEVLSPGTQSRDLGEKMRAYFTLPSLREYVVVASEAPAVTVYRRSGEEWTVHLTVGPEAVADLASLGIALSHADLYEDVTFAEAG